MELKFYGEVPPFFYENGVLKEEPEESLEELLERYKDLCDSYSKGMRNMTVAARPYTRKRWINGIEPVFLEDTKRYYAHRTRMNAEWSDITLALAADFDSPGEITTRKAAGRKWIGHPLPADLEELSYFYRDLEREAIKVARKIARHPASKAGAIRLNIAGNGAATLKRAGIQTGSVTAFISAILSACEDMGVKVLEIRSGGQSGVDEAAINAAQRRRMKCSILAPKDFRMRDEQGNEIEGREPFVERFMEETIDYEAWSKAKENDSLDWGMAEFGNYNAIDMLEWEIDLKITHINEREKHKSEQL